MTGFLERFWRTGVIFLIVAGLLFLALGGYLNPMVRLASAPWIATQRWLMTRYLAFYELVSSPQEMAALRQQVASLEEENARLRSQVIELQQELSKAQTTSALLDFARSRPGDRFVGASVIGRDPSPFLQYIFIDKGSDDGLRRGMPVVTAEGLVGRIDAVIANGARVQLITDPGAAVNVKIASSEVEAILSGSLTGELTLEMLPQEATLKVGDVVLTSGLGGNYPENILVGQVAALRQEETTLFQTALIQPAVDFRTIRTVLVITNFAPVDLSPLQPVSPVP
ncbi:rod shape-determining protein MreC [Anaerolinea sp.]|uniref:rod shape-determining protein MreC n=1 Tax=Anaerolinea sp. TaxID=1872519 RepID=UPI00262961FA|nr:rod shape-determining protein MreC [uncultured Anaerolinea sp.]